MSWCYQCSKERIICARCNGKGTIGSGSYEKQCPDCKGKGKVCPKCGN